MKKSYNENKYEVLAPAGSYECMLAAFNAGADAVYVGGQMFGARAFANNFTTEELINAIDYAHLHNKKL
jgi:putative protease